MFTEEQKQEFKEKSFELVKWLRENGHPHMTILIDQVGAELLEGQMAFPSPYTSSKEG